MRARDLINVFDFLLKRTNSYKVSAAMDKVRQVAARHQITTKPDNQPSSPSTSTSTSTLSTNADKATTAFAYEPIDMYAKSYYDMKEETVIGEMQVLKRCALIKFIWDVSSGSR